MYDGCGENLEAACRSEPVTGEAHPHPESHVLPYAQPFHRFDLGVIAQVETKT